MWLSWGQKSQIKYFLWQSACLPWCICDGCKHAILLLRKRGQSSDITLQLRMWVRGWEGQRTACPALGQPGDTIINVPTALPRLLGLLPVNKFWLSCKQICHSGKWNVPQDPQKHSSAGRDTEGTKPSPDGACLELHSKENWWRVSRSSCKRNCFLCLLWAEAGGHPEMLSIHYWGFAGVATGDTQEQPQPGAHRSLQEELSPCLCSGMLSCPSWLWNHTGGLTCTAPGGCRTGGGHSSPQLPKFGGKRQLQVLKMPIRTPNRLSSVAGRSTTTYQCMGSCVGVSREFKQPVEAEVLFLVEFVHVLFPQ